MSLGFSFGFFFPHPFLRQGWKSYVLSAATSMAGEINPPEQKRIILFSCRALVAQFESLLHSVAQSLKRRQCLVVLIDGADLIHAATGQLVSDWLPEQLPQVSLSSLSQGYTVLCLLFDPLSWLAKQGPHRLVRRFHSPLHSPEC